MIHSTTPASERADALAEAGEFEAAARARSQSAQHRLERFGIDSTASSDLAVADLLYAIYYAQRAGERRTALQLRGTLESYASLLQETAYTSLQTEWPETTRACLVGLFEEWIGEAHLLTGDENATEYYDRAESWYRIEEERATDDSFR